MSVFVGWPSGAFCPFCAALRKCSMQFLVILQAWLMLSRCAHTVMLAERETAFVGWSERELPGAFDERVFNHACVNDQDECEDWARKGECDRNPEFMRSACRMSCYVCEQYVKKSEHFGQNLTMSTVSGEIHVQMLWHKAPDMCHLMAELATGSLGDTCEFYRNEAAPESGGGPPYGLLQGVCESLSETPPKEVTTTIERGHIATIHPGKDFYIALSDHADWSAGHTAWGFIEDLSVVEALVARPFTTMVHATYGTEMRMMDERTQFSVFLADSAHAEVGASAIQQDSSGQ
eukprot:jgi/Ulvmu1/1054/UM105_0012.1